MNDTVTAQTPRSQAYSLEVATMWESVPPEAFETAHSTTGLFERKEIEVIGEFLAQRFRTMEDGQLVMLGCATGFREMQALKHAKIITGEHMHLGSITAIDIAPQFLERAERRLSMLKVKGFADKTSSHLCSLDSIDLHYLSKPDGGIAALSVYDLQCLLHRDSDGEDPVGLKEYGNNMHEILGSHTSIHPLFYFNHSITEGDPIISYHSADARAHNEQYGCIRKRLAEYCERTPHLLGLRIHIAHDRETLFGATNNALFISTWFSIPTLKVLLEDRGLRVEETNSQSYKGAVLALTAAHHKETGKFKNCALAMNNVIGNLATPTIMSHFIHSLWRFCSPGGSYGPI